MATAQLQHRVIPLTPPGRGAIASLRIEGPLAVELVDREFRPGGKLSLQNAASERPLYGRFGAAPGEDVVVRREPDQAVTIHCHGGAAASARILEQLERGGCIVVGWREWLAKREGDPFASAAHAALADARTLRTAAILADQWGGALRRAVEAIRADIVGGDCAAALEQLGALLARAQLGQHLVEPWRVAAAGPPNAGKSSLINALVGYARAIVHPTPGTTRDLVTTQTVIDGWPVQLVDTAGLRAAADPLEQEGIALARHEIAAADLVLVVFDRGQAWSDDEQRLATTYANSVVVYNKCDKCDREPAADMICRPPGIELSALTGQGIDVLLATVSRRLAPDPPAPGAAVPFTDDQIAALRAASEALAGGDRQQALARLP